LYLRFVTIFSLLLFPLLAQEEIRVHLTTESLLSPLYLGTLQKKQSSFGEEYLQDLEKVLKFDLQYNGHTNVIAKESEKEKLLLGDLQPMTWKKMGVAYVVKGIVHDHHLTLITLSTQTGRQKSFKEIPLTGEIAQDRRQIHKLADAINQELFSTSNFANTHILYCVQGSDKFASEIWQCDWDGKNARQVTKEHSYCVSPVFLSGNRFIYVSYKNGQPKIYIASLNEGVGKRLVDLKGNQLLPALTPSRNKLAFICDAAGRTDLFVQPFSQDGQEMGKPIQLFSYPRSTQASPTFSPDGSKIAFVSDKDGPPRVYIIPVSDSGKRAEAQLITKQNKESSCPAWSPDGTKLAYSAKTNAIRQIWIYDFKTGEERQLTSGPGNKENPCWAPDSLHLAFNSTDPLSSEIYLANLNQPEAIKITHGPGKKHYPTWGRK